MWAENVSYPLAGHCFSRSKRLMNESLKTQTIDLPRIYIHLLYKN